GDPLGIEQLELADFGCGLQVQHAFVGDSRVREIEPFQVGQARKVDHLDIVNPCAAQIHCDDSPPGVALNFSTQLRNPASVDGPERRGEQDRQQAAFQHKLLGACPPVG